MNCNATLNGGRKGIFEHMGCSNTGALLHQNDTSMSNAITIICMFPLQKPGSLISQIQVFGATLRLMQA